MVNQATGAQAPVISQLRIQKIDASAAVAGLRRQLETMLSGLSITGLRDFVGTEGAESSFAKVETAADRAADAIKRGQEETATFTAQMKQFSALGAGISNVYKKAIGGGSMIEDRSELERITQRYTEWQRKVEALKASRQAASGEAVRALAAEGLAIRDQIASIQQLQAAERKEAAEAKAAAQNKMASTAAIANLQRQVTGYMQANPKAAAQFGETLNGVMSSLSQSTGVTAAELGRLRGRFAEVRAEASRFGLEGQGAFEVIKNAYAKFGGWSLVTRSFVAAIRLIKETIHTVIELDTHMTDLKVITGEAASAYEGFARKAAIAAKQAGTSMSALLQSSTTWARLGNTLDDSLDLAKITAVFSSVAGIPIDEATTSMVSTLKAFESTEDTVDTAMSIADKFTLVGNKFAVDAQGLGIGMQNAASTLKVAGADIDESIALITGGVLVTQDPGKTGNALKTTALRIMGATASLEEMGEEVDDLVRSTPKLRNEILALSGVDIMADANNFKGLYDILKEISLVWDDLSERNMDQTALLELLGGKRNANVLSSILSNFDEVEAALETSRGAEGAALEANEIRLDSISGKLKQFRATYENFATTLVSTDLVKGIVDGGSAALSVITAIIDKLGAIPTLLGAIAMAVSTRNANSILTPFTLSAENGLSFGLGKSISEDMAAIKAYNAELAKGATTQTAFERTMQDASAAVRMAQNSNGAAVNVGALNLKLIGQKAASIAAATGQAILNAAWSMGISLLLSGLITGITSLINREQELRDTAREAAAEAADMTEQIGRLAISWLELSSAVDTNDGSKEALLSTQGELLRLLGEERISLDELIERYGSLNAAIKELAVSELQKAQRDLVSGVEATGKELYDSIHSWFGGTKDSMVFAGDNYSMDTMRFMEQQGYVSPGSYGSGGGTRYLNDFDLETPEGITEAYEFLGEILDALIGKYGAVKASEDAVYQGVYEKYKQLEGGVLDYQNAVSSLNENLATQHLLQAAMEQDLPETQEEFEAFRRQLIETAQASGTFAGSARDVEQAINGVLAGQSQFTPFLMPQTNEGETAPLVASLTDLKETLSSVKSAYELLGTAEEEMREKGGLTADTISKLAAETDRYLDFLYAEDGQVRLNTQGWSAYAASLLGADISELQRERNALLQEEARLIDQRAQAQSRLDELLQGPDNRPDKVESVDAAALEIEDYTAKLEDNSAAIERNQQLLSLYGSLAASVNMDSALTGMEALEASLSNFEHVIGVIDSFSGKLGTLKDVQNELANGFSLTLDKAMEFAAVFPDLLNNASVTADGMILLNKDVANSFVEGKRTEISAEVDAEIAKLEATKAGLMAKKAAAEGQLELANAVANGEVEIEKAKAALLGEAEQLLTQYLIDLGMNEVDAQKAAAEAKAGNMEEYSRIVGEVADDNAYNLAQSMVDAANSTRANVAGMVTSLDALGRQAANVAGQIAAVGEGKKTYGGSVAVGGGGSAGSSFSSKKGNYSFKGVDPKQVDAFNASLGEWISNIQLDISGYTAAIAQIDGQIAALGALKNMPLDKFKSPGSGSGGGGGSPGSGASKKEIEEYIAVINELYEAEERLKAIQEARKRLEQKSELTDSPFRQIEYQQQIIDLYQQEQQAMHQINELRRGMIQKNVSKLEAVGFQIDYDAEQNQLFVRNMEQINAITGKTTEETNELRKEYEQLLETTIDLNDACKDNSETWWDIQNSIKGVKNEIVGLRLGIYDDFIQYAGDFELWDDISFSKVDFLLKKLSDINRMYAEGLIPNAETYKELVNETALEIYQEQKNALDEIIQLTMNLIKQEAQDKIDALNKQIEAYQKIIDLRKQMLEQERDEESYQKEVAKRVKEIAKMQSRIDQLGLDDSREALAERKGLEEQLAEKQQELADYQADYAYNAHMDALDREAEAFSQSKRDEIEQIEATVDSTAKLYALAIDRINNHWDTLYKDLMSWNAEYGEGIAGENSIASAWGLAENALRKYVDTLSALEGIKTENSVSEQEGVTGNKVDTARASGLVAQMKTYSAQWHKATGVRKRELEAINEALAAQLSAILKRPVVKGRDGVWYLDNVGGARVYDKYHIGGVAGNQPTLKQNEVMAILEKGEPVLDARREKTLYQLIDFTTELSDKLGMAIGQADFSALTPAAPVPAGLDRSHAPRTAALGETFSPTVVVQLSHSGTMSTFDADRYGKRIAEVAMEQFREAFSKRGIRAGGFGMLRP